MEKYFLEQGSKFTLGIFQNPNNESEFSSQMMIFCVNSADF
jgi:hypothetical protein